MKRVLFIFSLLSFFVFTSCKDDVAPELLLKGDLNMQQVLNKAYQEPGYSAFDDVDGDLTQSVVVDSLDVNSTGTKYLSYNVSDKEGNSAQAVRVVTVYNEMKNLAGSWIGEYVFPYPSADKVSYTDSVSPSSSTNMNIIFKDFAGNLGANIEGEIVLSGDNAPAIVFQNQTINGETFTAHTTKIENNFYKVTIEYTIGGNNGIMVIAKQ